jgi:hypothetical protein
MVNVESVYSYPAVLLPCAAVFGLAALAELCACIVVGLSRMNGEEGVVKGSGHHVGGQEVIEEPLLSQLWQVARVNADGEGTEATWLVDGYQQVLHLERVQLEVAWVVFVLV